MYDVPTHPRKSATECTEYVSESGGGYGLPLGLCSATYSVCTYVPYYVVGTKQSMGHCQAVSGCQPKEQKREI